MSQSNAAKTSAGPIPVTVLTGFLGAGKTTLLNRILSENHGQKIAVIENEFGPESIDNDLLVQDRDEQIIEMNNGCVCCTVRGDLVRILDELRAKRALGKLGFDRVIIETTGMANPGPVCQTFFIDDSIASAYMLDGVITVVDAKHGHETLDTQTEAQNQVGFADRILVSKVDLVEDAEFQDLRARLVRMNPRAAITPANFGQADIRELLDLHGFNLNAILDIDPQFLEGEHPDAAEDAHSHDHHHHDGEACEHPSHSHAHAHHDDAIKAFIFKSDRAFDPVRLEEFLSGIVQVYGPDLLRYKGVLFVKGSNRRLLFQGVHQLMGAEPGRAWLANEKRNTKMVFIGRNLPQDIFNLGLEQCLA
ncbi:GTP-binding protein [Verticiella sediminum]|uniref:GTP-binding protein n=1 Tax=Verticiella sediminum TaxID=1247510 RepID=A0A556AAZ3_9BURK|nr:GTP-binding protein [Verticiella sediminum]TSH90064.1 GTP-binding protein [Verticiella sediminum]